MATVITPTAFKARFPEFSSIDDIRIQIFIDDALLVVNETTWGTLYSIAVYYLSAHYLALSEDSLNGNSGSVGNVSSQGVDGTSISFNTYSPDNSSQTYWLSTQYGQRFYSMIKSLGAMAFTV